MVDEDITGNLAHVAMLTRCGIITAEEGAQLTEGLEKLREDIHNGIIACQGDFEDVHSFVELTLTERLGDVGKKLHTARSRNDQIAVDGKLYCRRVVSQIIDGLKNLINALEAKGKEQHCLMPGYTHLQRAQTVTLAHHFGAYQSMLGRDITRLNNALNLMMEECPLGCGALAGTTHNIDCNFTAELLGFAVPSANMIDGVSDRDYYIEIASACSIIMVHLSRLSEELILWSTREFGFVTVDDRYATGSSMMSQKKNPDSLELLRGNAAPVFGALTSLLTLMKGLPLSYNKDMQLDKEIFMPAAERILQCLTIATGVVSTLKIHRQTLEDAVKDGWLNATEMADWLVQHGLAFRDAHEVVGKAVLLCEEQNRRLEDLSLEELQQLSPIFDQSIHQALDYNNIFAKGTKPKLIHSGHP